MMSCMKFFSSSRVVLFPPNWALIFRSTISKKLLCLWTSSESNQVIHNPNNEAHHIFSWTLYRKSYCLALLRWLNNNTFVGDSCHRTIKMTLKHNVNWQNDCKRKKLEAGRAQETWRPFVRYYRTQGTSGSTALESRQQRISMGVAFCHPFLNNFFFFQLDSLCSVLSLLLPRLLWAVSA